MNNYVTNNNFKNMKTYSDLILTLFFFGNKLNDMISCHYLSMTVLTESIIVKFILITYYIILISIGVPETFDHVVRS